MAYGGRAKGNEGRRSSPSDERTAHGSLCHRRRSSVIGITRTAEIMCACRRQTTRKQGRFSALRWVAAYEADRIPAISSAARVSTRTPWWRVICAVALYVFVLRKPLIE